MESIKKIFIEILGRPPSKYELRLNHYKKNVSNFDIIREELENSFEGTMIRYKIPRVKSLGKLFEQFPLRGSNYSVRDSIYDKIIQSSFESNPNNFNGRFINYSHEKYVVSDSIRGNFPGYKLITVEEFKSINSASVVIYLSTNKDLTIAYGPNTEIIFEKCHRYRGMGRYAISLSLKDLSNFAERKISRTHNLDEYFFPRYNLKIKSKKIFLKFKTLNILIKDDFFPWQKSQRIIINPPPKVEGYDLETAYKVIGYYQMGHLIQHDFLELSNPEYHTFPNLKIHNVENITGRKGLQIVKGFTFPSKLGKFILDSKDFALMSEGKCVVLFQNGSEDIIELDYDLEIEDIELAQEKLLKRPYKMYVDPIFEDEKKIVFPDFTININ